ncbi:MAG: methyl-accepting chemotaxis protein [Treponema sp.]|jgi:methyl-accepting chemotaxis protein|nr:methyl-accepting chemotaxis protein [Treponema sp.]
MKIQIRLTGIIMAMMIAMGLTLSVILVRYAAAIQMESSLLSQERLAAEQAVVIQMRYESYLSIAKTLSQAMADYTSIADPGYQRRTCTQIIQSITLANEHIVGIFAVFKPDTIDSGMDEQFIGVPGNTPSGQWAPWLTMQSGALEILTFNELSEIMALINGSDARRQMIEEPVPRTIAGKDTYTVRLSVPVIRRSNGEVVGRVGMNINTALTQAVIDNLVNDPAITDIVSMSLYSDKGTVIASDNPDYVGKPLSVGQAGFFGEQSAEAERKVTNGIKARYSRYSPRFGQNLEVILYPFSIGDTGVSWAVLMGTKDKTITAGVDAMMVFSVAVGAAFLVIMSVLIIISTRSITRPIVAITATLKDIAEGEGDLTRTIELQSRDEIGDMARYFNATLEKTKNLVLTIKKQSALLSRIGIDLASNMGETAAAINEIAANIRSIKDRIAHQSASVSQSNSVMEQITVHINTLSEYVLRQGECVSRSSSAIEQMIANIRSVTQTLIKNGDSVKELLTASEVGRTGLEDVVEDIQKIAREGDGLMEINEVIQNIARQTNLLSMNAAIEAAHAGDVGRGFAVVAEEIRKLSESSDEQSKTIAEVLNKIKESIDTITASTGSVLHKFETIDAGVRIVSDQTQNIRSAMEEQSAGSKQILEAMGLLSEVTELVKDTSAGMLEGSRQVMVESRNLGQATEEISSGINEMASGADQINEAVSKVNTLSNDNKENIEVLASEVGKFKVD